MSDRGRAAVALLLGGACGSCAEEAPIPAESLRVELTSTAAAVEFGVPFEMRFLLRHARSLEPLAFDPRRLSPLVVEERGRTVREDGATREESIRLEARAFAVDRVVIAPMEWTALDRASGAEHRTHTEKLEIAVRSSLAKEHGRDPELPFSPREARSFWPWMIAGFALLAGVLGFAWSRRRVSPATREASTPPSPAEAIEITIARELAGLELRCAEAEADRAEGAAFATSIARLLRAALEARAGLPASVRTRAELAADSALRARVPESDLRALDEMLRLCEWVQFARAGFRSGEALGLLRAARRFVAAVNVANIANAAAYGERSAAESRA